MNKRTLYLRCQNEQKVNIKERESMRKAKSLTGLALAAAVGAVSIAPTSALAVPAFARVNNLPCSTCHTAFPKLTAFGENFMRNGFQLQEGGAEPARRDLSFASALDFLAFRGRMKLYESKDNQTLGTTQTNATVTSIGTNEQTYLYVAGSAWKNISVWMENSLVAGGGTSNYALGFHNLGGTSLANIRFGRFTNTEWLSVSNQKRFLDPAYIAYAVATSTAATSKDRVTSGGATDSVELYGNAGPAFYGLGYTPGASTSANSEGNHWGTVRYDISSGAVAGSNISAQYYSGTDTNGTLTGKNKFSFTNIGGNLRLENLELYGFYVKGKEDNYNFAGAKRDHTGHTVEANYKLSPEFSAAVRYEVVNSDVNTGDQGLLTPGIVYSPYENLRIMAYYANDLDKDGDGKKSNTFLTNLQFAF